MKMCEATFPWNREPCPNEAEFTRNGRGLCYECMDEERELERERCGRDNDDMNWRD